MRLVVEDGAEKSEEEEKKTLSLLSCVGRSIEPLLFLPLFPLLLLLLLLLPVVRPDLPFAPLRRRTEAHDREPLGQPLLLPFS
jgi:hypothetical protein